MEHLALEIFDREDTDSQYARLEQNTSISISDTSEIFASGDVWSHSFTLNIPANAHIFGTAGEIHGSRLHEQINKRRARLWVEGLPLFLGYIKLDDEVQVDADGNVEVKFESGQKTFEELIEGAKANQVPMMSDIRIGVALWRKRSVQCSLKLTAEAVFDDGSKSVLGAISGINGDNISISNDGGTGADTNPAQQYPRMVFPKGDFKVWESDYKEGEHFDPAALNTDYPYSENENGVPTHPYCNVALCYQKYGFVKKMQDNTEVPDYSAEPEAQRGYEYMPANRVNSAPNFFVLYWLRALMKHLNIHIEENQMLGIQDLCRLFFVNTNCAYKPLKRRDVLDPDIKMYRFAGTGRLIAERFDQKKNIKIEDSFLTGADFTASTPTITPAEEAWRVPSSKIPTIKQINIRIKEVVENNSGAAVNEANNSYFHDAYATSECFPDVDISEVIKALENGFGVRFLFNGDYKRVRIVLLRNIFRSGEVQEISCDVLDKDEKIENNIRGFRMTYGASEDSHFYYKGFADKLPHKKELWQDTSDTHDYSKWDLDADYGKLINKITAFDTTCYVTPNNGNAYGIKVDKDAKRYDELHPSLFGFADFMDAEDGDCSGEEETIKEINVGFKPAIMNDLNMDAEREGNSGQRFALFVDEKMRPRRPDLKTGIDYNDADAVYDVDYLYSNKSPAAQMKADGVVKPGEFAVTSDFYATAKGLGVSLRKIVGYTESTWEEVQHDAEPIYANWDITNLSVDGHINEGYRLYLQDNYEPNDDGISPIETHDWGLTLGIMRGSGSDAYVDYRQDPDDGEGNVTWDIVPGSNSIAHPDTCDSYGGEWDYNGQEVATKYNAQEKLYELFPNSNAYFYVEGLGYAMDASLRDVTDGNGLKHKVLFVYKYGKEETHPSWYREYAKWLTKKLKERNAGIEEIYSLDRGGNGTLSNVVVEVDSSDERAKTMLELCTLAYGNYNVESIIIDNGIGSRYGRFSLKLRAEKPNPYFDASQEESDENPRYLTITNPNLRQRGLADQFYKEYSYWVRNARIVRRTVRMTLAQLLAIDKTVRVTVGDVTGFIRKMEYTISNETGLGNVTMEIMYI